METGHQVDSSNYKVLKHMPSAFTINPTVWKTTHPTLVTDPVPASPYNPGTAKNNKPDLLTTSTSLSETRTTPSLETASVPRPTITTPNEGASAVPPPATAPATHPQEGAPNEGASAVFIRLYLNGYVKIVT